MKTLTDFDLNTRHGRYRARKAGLDVPKLQPGKPPADLDSLVDKSGDCWEWLGTKNKWGYGRLSRNGKEVKPHREMYERVHGALDPDVVLMHSCDNPGCVNPAHLTPGTHELNQLDKVAKGRHARGEQMGTAKLREAAVREMRQLYQAGGVTYADLSARYSVCKDTIHKALTRKYWSHVA